LDSSVFLTQNFFGVFPNLLKATGVKHRLITWLIHPWLSLLLLWLT